MSWDFLQLKEQVYNFLTATVWEAVNGGVSGNDGGPRDSNLTDGNVTCLSYHTGLMSI